MAVLAITHLHFHNLQMSLNQLAEKNHISPQKSLFQNIKAQAQEALVQNPIRNHIESLQRKIKYRKNVPDFKNMVSCLEESTKHLHLSNQQKETLKPYYTQFKILRNYDNRKNQNQQNTITLKFFKEIFQLLPKEKRKLGKALLRKALRTSSLILNDINFRSADIKNHLTIFFESIELLSKFIPTIKDKEHKENTKIWKDLQLLTISYSVLYLGFEKRSFTNKAKVFLKQILIPLAYTLCAVLGTILEHFLTQRYINFLLGIIGITSTFFLNFFLLSLLGILGGYYISSKIEKASHFVLNSARISEQKKCLQFLNQKLKQIGLRPFQNNKNLKKIVPYREKAKKVKYTLARKKNLRTPAENNKNREFLDSIKKIFQDSKLKENEYASQFFFTLHEIVNNNQNLSLSEIQKKYKECEKLINKFVPQKLSNYEKKVILEYALGLSLHNRALSTSILRKSCGAVYLSSDLLTDFAGMQTAAATEQGMHSTPDSVQIGLEFSANFLAGLVPMGLGIFLYLFLKAKAARKDSKEVHIPNDFVRPMAIAHLKKELAKAKCLLIWFDEKRKITPEQKNRWQNKLSQGQIPYFQINENKEVVNVHFTKDSTLIPEMTLSWPVTQTRVERLRTKVFILEEKLRHIEALDIKKSNLKA